MSGSGYHALGAGEVRRVGFINLVLRADLAEEALVIFARASSEYRFRLGASRCTFVTRLGEVEIWQPEP
jgi:hypothetical protein